ncbi:FHA domain-containing protein [Streptomyces diastatochromogenes]|nr:FHA domain-containing protein [Streptomyces diastatochromogenes]
MAGPDAGGVHLLHGGAIRIGRSVDADVPLDDPDVSRSHCTVTVGADGRVTVADHGSTNGTTLDGLPVGERPVPLRPGALLRLGESALRLTGPGDGGTDAVATAPDGEGHLRVAHATDLPERPGPADDATHGGARGIAYGEAHAHAGHPMTDPTATTTTSATTAASRAAGPGARRPRLRPRPRAAAGAGSAPGPGGWRAAARSSHHRGPCLPGHARRRPARPRRAGRRPGPVPVADTWPDPATVLLTALGPGPRLWERPQDHPEALVVRLGTADRAELSGVPVTVGLREVGSLGLAGPGDRLTGLARSVVAQLAALHSPPTWRSSSSAPTGTGPWRSGGAPGAGSAGSRTSARPTARTAGCSWRTTASRPRRVRPS